MAYITPTEIDALLKFLIEKFENFQFMDYEMFNGQDRFGKMMVKNFQERGCPLKVIFVSEKIGDCLFPVAGWDQGLVS